MTLLTHQPRRATWMLCVFTVALYALLLNVGCPKPDGNGGEPDAPAYEPEAQPEASPEPEVQPEANPEPEAQPVCADEGQLCTLVSCCDGLTCVAHADSAQCEVVDDPPACHEENMLCSGGNDCCEGLGCFNAVCVPAPKACETEWDCDGRPCLEGNCDVCGENGDTCYGSGGCCDGQFCNITGYIDGHCAPEVQLGGQCLFWDSCADGLFCQEGTCMLFYALGATCEYDFVCNTQRCIDGSCAESLSAGSACTASHHCESGICTEGQCQ